MTIATNLAKRLNKHRLITDIAVVIRAAGRLLTGDAIRLASPLIPVFKVKGCPIRNQ